MGATAGVGGLGEGQLVQTRHYDMQEFIQAEHSPGNHGAVSAQLMRLHREVLAMNAPMVLECGVNRGQSTGFFAWACEQNGGRLVSVDINNCSDAIVSPVWTFIQSDDTRQDIIFAQVPQLYHSIDFLYIDSLHTARHVEKLLMLYYLHVRQGGIIAVDDVDPLPYLRGKPKDNKTQEITWRQMGAAVRHFFYANEDALRMEIYYGSTGLAIIRKLVPAGTPPRSPRSIRPRHFSVRDTLKRWIGYA